MRVYFFSLKIYCFFLKDTRTNIGNVDTQSVEMFFFYFDATNLARII